MKAEHRKELKANTLVSTLEKVGHGLKQGPSRRTVVIGGIVLLVVLLIVGWYLIKAASDRRTSRRWTELYTATSIDDLDQLVENEKNTVQGRAAEMQIARDKLTSGLDKIYDQRDSSVKKMREAADSFAKLAKEFKSTPILVQECLFGEAQAREAVGELDEAIGLCEDLSQRFPESPFAEQAEDLAKKIRSRKADLLKLQDQLKKNQ